MDFEDNVVEAEAEKPKDEAETVRQWLAEIDAAAKREKEYRKQAKDIVEIYETDKEGQTPFNILYSNTETLAPALYNAVPRPIVAQRYKDTDPLAQLAAKISQRTLEFMMDTDGREYPSFDDLMISATLSALVPGRGITRFKYDATYSKVEPTEEGQEPYDKVESEQVCGDEVAWNHFLMGYAKKWEDVPWISFTHFMTEEELKLNFGEEAAGVELSAGVEDTDDTETKTWLADSDSKGVKLACVYEIWDKSSKEVIFISTGKKERPLKRVDDPLQLSGFYPCPAPVQLFQRVSSMLPVPIYRTYEEQAKELNSVTSRITALIKALKVRGFYDGTLTALSELLNSDDNTLLAADNVAAMQQGQTLEKSIWLMPLDKIITTLQQLYIQRQGVKQVIYEITGIADIMRGSSVASETLGAQEIKNQWGTLRLKRMQKRVARHARDCLRIMLEIAVTKLSPETFKAMTGIKLPTAQEKQQAQMMIQQAQASGMPVPPDVEGLLQVPTWEDIIGLLRTDLLRQYKIDIETNSTVDAEATEDKANVSEFLNAMAQFFNGVTPLVESGSLPFEAAREIMLATTRKFRFGVEVEDALAKMKAPQPKPEEQPPQPTPAEQAAAQTALATEQMKQETLRMEAELAREEHAFKMQEIQRKGQISMMTYQAKAASIEQQARASKTAGAQ